MAKLDFPDASYSPWVAPNNVIYTYIGTSPNGYWEANTANAATNLTAVFVERTGSTMTGRFKLDNAGSVSLPDISFDGDINTGLFQPGADSLSITTAGTQRVTVDSDGKLLINTSTAFDASSQGLLQIQGPTNSYALLSLQRNDTSVGAGNALGVIDFFSKDGGTSVKCARIRASSDDAAHTDTGRGTKLQFYTTPNDSINIAERLTINNIGNVGIGDLNPQSRLVVQGTNTDAIIHIKGLSDSSGNGASTFDGSGAGLLLTAYGMNTTAKFTPAIQFGSTDPAFSTTNPKVGAAINGIATEQYAADTTGGMDLAFYTTPNIPGTSQTTTERLRILENGNVGIGTSIPGNNLEVVDTTAGIKARATGNTSANMFLDSNRGVDVIGGQLVSQWNSSAVSAIRFVNGDDAVNKDNGHIAFSTASAGSLIERMRINSSGNVGIGTTSPSQPLDVAGWVKTSVGLLGTTGRVSTASGGINISTGATVNPIIFTGGTGSANVERMRIDTSGNILIGRTSYGRTGNGHSIRGGDSAVFSRNATGESMMVCRNSSNGDLIQFRRNDTICGEIRSTGSTTVAYQTSSDYRLKENVIDITDGINRVKQLAPKRFNFIADGPITVDGFLAHEAQAVVPESVSGTKDEVDDDGNDVMQGIDQSKLVPLLTAALQEAIAKIETLEQRLSDAGIA